MILHFLDGVEDETAQPFVPDRPVVALDIGVLLWFTRLDVGDGDVALLGPGQQRAADIFGATRIVSGLPRHSMIRFSDRTTRIAGNEKSTSIPSPSRLKSSMTFKVRNERPSASWSAMKSDLAPKFYPILSSLQRFWVAVFWAVAAGCGAEPFRLRSTASRRGLIV